MLQNYLGLVQQQVKPCGLVAKAIKIVLAVVEQTLFNREFIYRHLVVFFAGLQYSAGKTRLVGRIGIMLGFEAQPSMPVIFYIAGCMLQATI